MNALFALQHKFQEHLLNAEDAIFNDIVNTEKVTTDVRLSIYSHAYRSRLLEALATNFPVLQIYLGDEQFAALGNAYMDRCPSHYRSIRWFGDQLENFLLENPPYTDFAYLAELAKVEWTMTLIFDAVNSEVFTLEKLGNIPPENWVNMRLFTHPSLHQMQLFWNIVPIWQALSEEEAPHELLQSETPVTWIFWRHDLISHYCSLPQAEANAFDAMSKGQTFDEICEVFCQDMDENEIALRAASLLQKWISSGFIVDITY